ncbi:MAG: sulfite exporter TauE/SafE family protein [Flavobacteriales bacterium]|nr:sulfite exporter TauE/SafE family protein [Flavobacteriales bacterium]
MSVTTILILLLIGAAAGFASGFVGVGGGIIIVPALVFFLGFSQHMAQGTSLALMLPPIGLLGFYNYYKSGNANIYAALVIAVAFILGAYFGSKLSITLDQRLVKKIFGGVMLVASLKMLIGK